MYITLFISTLHNIDDISFVLLYGSSRKNNTGQSELTEKKLWCRAPRLIHAREPSAEASRGWGLSAAA